ncbi:MAG: DHH family phosphoesterase [Conexivisphaerales archaeon]|nr:DHH family phosphoesterase [Conexivisphaerales archaeon]
MTEREEYEKALRKAVEAARRAHRAVVVHHDDADGLAAGAISLRTMDVIGLKARAICIEKMHPAIVKMIHAMDADLFVYADIGSSRADLISEALREGQMVIVLDHHDPASVSREEILHLNPELYGYEGERDVSGSTAAYMLLRAVEPEVARELAWAAVVGSAEIPGPMRGLDAEALEDAERAGDVERRQGRTGERYFVKAVQEYWDRASTIYTVLGSVGYYSGGPERAVAGILRREIPREEADKLEELRSRKFDELFSKVYREGLRKMRAIQWMDDGGVLSGLGTKVIGTFLSVLSHRRIVDQEKYLVGMMEFSPEIPGLGRVDGRWIKASVRTPDALRRSVEAGRMPPASRLLEYAMDRIGGVAEGHAYAASGLLPWDARDEFLALMDSGAMNEKELSAP